MRYLIFISLVLVAPLLHAQERVTTFGIQFKPIIPSNLLRAGEVGLTKDGIDFAVDQRLGYSFGGVVRRGFTKWLSMESGISYVRRNFAASVSNASGSFTDTTAFRIIGYEIPITGLVYVQLSDYIYMNTAFGFSLDMFPSNVGSGNSNDFFQKSFRRSWVLPGLIANIGWEWRTKKSGYFYVGASYHRPFVPIYDTDLYYDHNGQRSNTTLQLSGNYLTIDFRYFFHEEPEPKKVKMKEEDMPQWMKNGKK